MDEDKEETVEQAMGAAKKLAKYTFRILIMDSVEHVDQLKEACKNAGHSVLACHTIESAFAFLDGVDNADVIICAAYLEDESLFDFLERLRTTPLHKGTKFMTLALAPGHIGARSNAVTEKAGDLLGADAFISMPVFDPEQLLVEIEKLLPSVPLKERRRTKAEQSRAVGEV